MERQSKESRGLEAHCRGGQGPPRAVAPSGGGGRVIPSIERGFMFLQSLASFVTAEFPCGTDKRM